MKRFWEDSVKFREVLFWFCFEDSVKIWFNSLKMKITFKTK